MIRVSGYVALNIRWCIGQRGARLNSKAERLIPRVLRCRTYSVLEHVEMLIRDFDPHNSQDSLW